MTDEDKTRVQPVGKLSATGIGESKPSEGFGQQIPPSTSALSGSESDQTVVAEATQPSMGFDSSAIFSDSSLYAAAVQPSSLGVGDVLKGRFEIVEILGEGGMGIVFKAVDIRKLEAKSRNPYVAIKVLNPALASNATLIAGLQRECEKAQELSHPNIITVYDFDRDGDYVFMSMEYLVGQSLSAIIRQAGGSGGLKLERAWPIIRQMGDALAYAHKKNIVHSDFKPANVFVTDHDEVKVLDFGIASRLGQSDTDETVFNARAEGGMTPPYASFEMLNGSKADQRDDIYAFGLVVYELLSGRHPYERKPASKVFLEQRSGQRTEVKPVRGLNRKQWQLLKSAIEILQEQRPVRLDEWLKQFDPKQQSKWVLAALFGLIVASSVGVGIYYLQPASQPPAAVKVPPVVDRPKPVPDIPVAAPKIEPPIADAGSAMQGVVGETVVLNASGSRTHDGSPPRYAWKFVGLPLASKAVLMNPDTVAPQFLPDQAGLYTVELAVTDAAGRASQPVTISINVAPAPEPAVAHEATSVDGSLFLGASKPSYRIGEELKLNFHVTKPGYLRVAYVSTTGEISELLPNKYQSSKVRAGVDYRIPPKPNTFKLQVTGPVGIDKIVAVFSSSPIPKVKDIATPDGALVDALNEMRDSAVTIRYDVLPK